MAPRRPLALGLGFARFALALGLFSAAGSLVACDADGDIETLELSALDERFACGDLTVVAGDREGSQALMLGIDDGLAAEVLAGGQLVEARYALPDERLTLRWIEGDNVLQGQCGYGTLTGPDWRVEERHEAIAGNVDVILEPLADGTISVTAALDGVLLVDVSDDEGDEQAYELAPTQIEALVAAPHP